MDLSLIPMRPLQSAGRSRLDAGARMLEEHQSHATLTLTSLLSAAANRDQDRAAAGTSPQLEAALQPGLEHRLEA